MNKMYYVKNSPVMLKVTPPPTLIGTTLFIGKYPSMA